MSNFKVTPLIPGLYCCLCFEQLNPEDCAIDDNGQKWDICKTCYLIEQLMIDLKEYGRHSEGCSYPHNKKYGCKCGYLDKLKKYNIEKGEENG
jgi:hypothetical protein